MKEYPETHQQGVISIENMPDKLNGVPAIMRGDLGIQIVRDGRIWVCINGMAFLRFSPHLNGKMGKGE